MDVLVACEYSATVRDAFRGKGHNSWSNDIIECDKGGNYHIQGDCIDAIKSRNWDLVIIHIPCTAMGVCGNGTYGKGKPKHHMRLEAIKWSKSVWEVACEHSSKVAMENPASVLFPILRDEYGADVQYIHPWQFGHMEQKKTGLALHGLSRLIPTDDVYQQMMLLPKNERERIFYMSPSADRGKERARFYSGIADAMACQWGRTNG